MRNEEVRRLLEEFCASVLQDFDKRMSEVETELKTVEDAVRRLGLTLDGFAFHISKALLESLSETADVIRSL